MIKKTESLHLTCLDANNLYGWAISQKLPVNGFVWYNDYLSDFNENYNENNDERYFIEVDIKYPKNYGVFIKSYHFYQKEENQRKQINLFAVQKRKKNMSYT